MKHERILRDILTEQGLTVDKMQVSRHVKFYCTARDGRKVMLVAGRTPSDRRALQNFAADARRAA